MQLRPYFRRWADWMLTTDKRQRIRLAMSGLAALLMAIGGVIAACDRRYRREAPDARAREGEPP